GEDRDIVRIKRDAVELSRERIRHVDEAVIQCPEKPVTMKSRIGAPGKGDDSRSVHFHDGNVTVPDQIVELNLYSI
ncbi:MAG TPA: hypothetical protein VF857_01565, partial [Spirochaetota bacterium]